MNNNQIKKEYLKAIEDFELKLSEIDSKYNTFGIIEIDNDNEYQTILGNDIRKSYVYRDIYLNNIILNYSDSNE